MVLLPQKKPKPPCKPGKCCCCIVIHGTVFNVYRCCKCGQEEWL